MPSWPPEIFEADFRFDPWSSVMQWVDAGFEPVQPPTRCAVAEEFGVASPRDKGVQNALRAFSRKRQGQLAQDDVFCEFIRR